MSSLTICQILYNVEFQKIHNYNCKLPIHIRVYLYRDSHPYYSNNSNFIHLISTILTYIPKISPYIWECFVPWRAERKIVEYKWWHLLAWWHIQNQRKISINDLIFLGFHVDGDDLNGNCDLDILAQSNQLEINKLQLTQYSFPLWLKMFSHHNTNETNWSMKTTTISSFNNSISKTHIQLNILSFLILNAWQQSKREHNQREQYISIEQPLASTKIKIP